MLLKQGLKNGRAVHEGLRVRKDGTTFWGSIVITALHNDNGEVIGFAKITRDLTEKKNTENKLKAQAHELALRNEELITAKKQVEKNLEDLGKTNEELQKFAFMVSHDLQEPRRKIRTYFSSLCMLNEKSFDEKSKECVKKINYSTERMGVLIKDLLSLSTISTEVTLSSVDLNKVVAQVVEDLEMNIEDRTAVIEIDSLPLVKGVDSYLQQLFLNLVSNALKFNKGTPIIKINARTENNLAIINIIDNGIGIDEQYLNRIFHPFEKLHARTEFEGTGIGLAICKRIIDIHHGTIEVQSKPGEGTTFTITLTMAEV